MGPGRSRRRHIESRDSRGILGNNERVAEKAEVDRSDKQIKEDRKQKQKLDKGASSFIPAL